MKNTSLHTPDWFNQTPTRRTFLVGMFATMACQALTANAENKNKVLMPIDEYAKYLNQFSTVEEPIKWLSNNQSMQNNMNLLLSQYKNDNKPSNQELQISLENLMMLVQGQAERKDQEYIDSLITDLCQQMMNQWYHLNLYNGSWWWKLLQRINFQSHHAIMKQDQNITYMFWDVSQYPAHIIYIADKHSKFRGYRNYHTWTITINAAALNQISIESTRIINKCNNPLFKDEDEIYSIVESETIGNEFAHHILKEKFGFDKNSKINWVQEIKKRWYPLFDNTDSRTVSEYLSDVISLWSGRFRIIEQLKRLVLPISDDYRLSANIFFTLMQNIIKDKESNDAQEANYVLEVLMGNENIERLSPEDMLIILIDILEETDIQYIIDTAWKYWWELMEVIRMHKTLD